MHGPQQNLNIPTEIARTIVVIAETRSLTKAAERLGLSQPAVSSQIKRIQCMIGGALFQRTSNGTVVTDLGKLALNQARKMLEANDQMLRLGGSANAAQPIRVGVTNLYVRQLLQPQNKALLSNVIIHTDNSNMLTQGLIDGFMDVACIFETDSMTREVRSFALAETNVPFVWVRSRDFTLSPGQPLPLLTWPGVLSDDLMIHTLQKHGIGYRIAFASPDHHAKLAATEMGYGLTVTAAANVPASLVAAKEYYLPALPPVKLYLCVRPGLETKAIKPLIGRLKSLFFPEAMSADAELRHPAAEAGNAPDRAVRRKISKAS